MPPSLSGTFDKYSKRTKQEIFLTKMDGLIPWQALCAVIEPHYTKAGNGQPPRGLERMLRMYFVAHWFNLADEACEEFLYDTISASVLRL
jgi:IS5 family transposase